MHAFQDRFPNEVFCLYYSLSLFHHFLCDRLGDYKNAVAVTQDVIARLDVDPADVDGNIVSDEPPAADDINRSRVARKDGKFQLKDVVGVACASINYGATGATKLCSLGREFTQMGR